LDSEGSGDMAISGVELFGLDYLSGMFGAFHNDFAKLNLRPDTFSQ
jgi:hypothetical protein